MPSIYTRLDPKNTARLLSTALDISPENKFNKTTLEYFVVMVFFLIIELELSPEEMTLFFGNPELKEAAIALRNSYRNSEAYEGPVK